MPKQPAHAPHVEPQRPSSSRDEHAMRVDHRSGAKVAGPRQARAKRANAAAAHPHGMPPERDELGRPLLSRSDGKRVQPPA